MTQRNLLITNHVLHTTRSAVRLFADEGKVLIKGTDTATVRDVELSDVANWTEINAPLEPETVIGELEGLV